MRCTWLNTLSFRTTRHCHLDEAWGNRRSWQNKSWCAFGELAAPDAAFQKGQGVVRASICRLLLRTQPHKGSSSPSQETEIKDFICQRIKSYLFGLPNYLFLSLPPLYRLFTLVGYFRIKMLIYPAFAFPQVSGFYTGLSLIPVASGKAFPRSLRGRADRTQWRAEDAANRPLGCLKLSCTPEKVG